ncbi:hypothetical protein [Nocardiopsis aegyptia]|uniref:Uncharacterized protein n=1 Tax=Nocardiopsis aegyptia TaxID=220378 RepID=A0A7Z0ELR6_9ACTN|nr:hypothetical protein [Nocardiopsis aegyptia]NYJ34361.1 hypothetical protein [Nocardiopsis aegyptia]
MRYLRSVDLEAVRATAARSFHLTRAPEPSDPLSIRERTAAPAESVVVSLPIPVDRPPADEGGWERRPLAPVIDLCEHYRHGEGRPGLRVAAFRACSCDWVERPRPHRPKHARCEAEPLRPRRRRRASRVRAYVSHPGGDLAPLALAVRSWMAVVGTAAPDGGRGPGLGAVA